MAIVSAPPIQTATVRHVEVLLLQPQVLMVVMITSTGGVSKRVFTFERPVDAGLTDWAASPQRGARRPDLGARTLRSRLTDPTLPPTERAFLEGCRPRSPTSPTRRRTRSTSRAPPGCCRAPLPGRLPAQRAARHARAPRLAARDALAGARPARPLRAHRRRERGARAAGLSLVAANYGLPQRNLGTVSVIGPTRMDYADRWAPSATPRCSCRASSKTSTTRTEPMPRDYYEVLGVGRAATRPRSRRRSGASPASCTRTPTPTTREAEEQFKEAAEAYEVLSDADRRRQYDAYGHEGLRTGGYAPTSRASARSRTCSPRSSARAASTTRSAPAAAARRPDAGRATSSSRSRSTWSMPRAASTVEVAYEVASRCEHCHGNGAEPGTPIVTCSRCHGSGQLQAISRTRFGQLVRTAVCDVCGGDGRVPEQPCERLRRRGQTHRGAHAVRRRAARASPTASGSGSAAAATRASAAVPTATSTSSSGCARTSASCATARTCTR